MVFPFNPIKHIVEPRNLGTLITCGDQALLPRFHALVIGCGLGRAPWVKNYQILDVALQHPEG